MIGRSVAQELWAWRSGCAVSDGHFTHLQRHQALSMILSAAEFLRYTSIHRFLWTGLDYSAMKFALTRVKFNVKRGTLPLRIWSVFMRNNPKEFSRKRSCERSRGKQSKEKKGCRNRILIKWLMEAGVKLALWQGDSKHIWNYRKFGLATMRDMSHELK